MGQNNVICQINLKPKKTSFKFCNKFLNNLKNAKEIKKVAQLFIFLMR